MVDTSPYYVESIDSLPITREKSMVRTTGMKQLCAWFDYGSRVPDGNWELDREYSSGIISGQIKVFTKRVLSLPNDCQFSIRDFVKYSAESILLLEDIKTVPRLIAYSDDTIVTEFKDGKSLKTLFMEKVATSIFLDSLVPFLAIEYHKICKVLLEHGRYYDLSINNILVDIDSNAFHFVDFDFSAHYVGITDFTTMLFGLANGFMLIAEDGDIKISVMKIVNALRERGANI